MNRRPRRSSLRSLIFGDMRTFAIVLLGGFVYLLLFLTFGGQHILGTRSSASEAFPRKVWQSWKNDALSFEARDSERARSWLIKNPAFRHEVLTDASGVAYVEQVFGSSGFNRPDIVQTYKALNARIIQADLLRYIIMYAEGGIWADVDVEALQSFEHFIPDRFDEKGLGMIIGIETDEPDFKDHPILGSKAQSFCQWVFVCKPRLPIMMRLIDRIIIWLKELAVQQSKEISDLSLTFDEVLSGTGPSAFTAVILAEMSATTGKAVTWTDFHGIRESKALGNILVLPSEAFAAGTLHSHSGNHQGAGALARHHFHASGWTTSHARFKHPVYGEVERCNWDPECVKLWDANTAFFNALSNEDQMRIIAMKDLDVAKAAALKVQSDAQIALAAPQEGPEQVPAESPGNEIGEDGPSLQDSGSRDEHEQEGLLQPEKEEIK